MSAFSFYISSCGQAEVDAFEDWLLAQGFALVLNDMAHFRGNKKVFARGALAIVIIKELEMWSFSVNNTATTRGACVDDLMEFLGKGAVTYSDPLRNMKFLRENVGEVQALVESADFEKTASQIKELAFKRLDRMAILAKQTGDRARQSTQQEG